MGNPDGTNGPVSEAMMASQAARACCAELGLEPDRDAEYVMELAADPEIAEPCCDSGCDPCVETLLSAARLFNRRRAAGNSGGDSA
jgi:hypothetical protein